MNWRTALLTTVLVGGTVLPAAANELKAEQARRFVVGKFFSFTCFEGSTGAGRIFNDGSVAGTIRFQGEGAPRYVTLPPGTLHVRGDNVCASLKGMAAQPCFDVKQTSQVSFRGALAGFNFAYCDFTRRGRLSIAEMGGTAAPRAATGVRAASASARAAGN